MPTILSYLLDVAHSQYAVLPVSINRMKTKRGGLMTICNNNLQL